MTETAASQEPLAQNLDSLVGETEEGLADRLRAVLMELLADPSTRRRTDRMLGVAVLDALDLPQPGSDSTVARHRRLARASGLAYIPLLGCQASTTDAFSVVGCPLDPQPPPGASPSVANSSHDRTSS